MAIGDLNPAEWRIDVYELKPANPFTGAVTDLSTLYTSDLTIKKQRNYPDEIHFTLDLQQLENRATNLSTESHSIIEPYKHKVLIFRNGEFMAQGIVMKVSANLNNQSKNTLEIDCVDVLSLFEKRLIHQDYGEGSWADFAKQVVYDAQHEPNRIYNYAWEGDGTGIDNAWFRGWKFKLGDELLEEFPEWEPNKLYSMYDRCTHGGKFWEAKEHAFISGETFSESNWTLLGIMDPETGEITAAYGIWREDDEEPGPTGTALGGWGGTSSCHMTAKELEINNGGEDHEKISLKNCHISTTLVAPFREDDLGEDGEIYSHVMVKDVEAKYEVTEASLGTKVDFKAFDETLFTDQLMRTYPDFLSNGDFVTSIQSDRISEYDTVVSLVTSSGKTLQIWEGDIESATGVKELARWGITVNPRVLVILDKNSDMITGVMAPIKTPADIPTTVPLSTFILAEHYHFVGWNTEEDGSGKTYLPGDSITINENTILYAMWEIGDTKFVTYSRTTDGEWSKTIFIDDLKSAREKAISLSDQYEKQGKPYDIKIAQEGWPYD